MKKTFHIFLCLLLISTFTVVPTNAATTSYPANTLVVKNQEVSPCNYVNGKTDYTFSFLSAGGETLEMTQNGARNITHCIICPAENVSRNMIDRELRVGTTSTSIITPLAGKILSQFTTPYDGYSSNCILLRCGENFYNFSERHQSTVQSITANVGYTHAAIYRTYHDNPDEGQATTYNSYFEVYPVTVYCPVCGSTATVLRIPGYTTSGSRSTLQYYDGLYYSTPRIERHHFTGQAQVYQEYSVANTTFDSAVFNNCTSNITLSRTYLGSVPVEINGGNYSGSPALQSQRL